ncbi:MAG TPA: restriction endonuclease [Anaerolineales bacterium]|nr:restriction endonuclease [Anaerolineales bacterium]
MAVPDFQTIMLPLLKAASDGQEHSGHEFLEQLAEYFQLGNEELNELLPSGKQTRFYNRVGWARTYLIKSKLLEMPKRSFYRITERGKEVLASNPSRIDMNYLKRFPEYIEFKEKENERKEKEQIEEIEESTPEEVLENAYQEIRETLAQEVLENVMACSPSFFERLVVELLVAMGYGGSRRDAARAVGQTGDEGIDGIIDEDRLGLDTIYVQAKKWANSVGRPEIQKFVGALAGKRAKKGIFITTSFFSLEAAKYASDIDTKVILIDGKRLAELMIDYNIGVNEVTIYKLKRIDSDYFTL